MLTFCFEFCFIGILWFFSSFVRTRKIQTALIVLGYCSIMFLTCFRSVTIDPDTPVYINYFKIINNISWGEVFTSFRSFEIGDIFLFKVIGSIWFNNRFFIVSMACITTIPIFVFIHKKSKNTYLSLLIFLAMDFWFGTIFLMRQYVALSLCLLAYSCLSFKGFFKSFILFLLCVMTAFLFHQSAIFFLPVYFLKYLKRNVFTFIAFAALFALFVLLGNQIVTALNRYSRISYDVTYSGGVNLLIFMLAFVVAIPIFAPGFLDLNSSNRFLYMMLLYTVLIQILALRMGNMTRAAKFPMVSLIVLIPNFLDYFCKQKPNINYKPFLYSAAFILFGAFFFVSLKNNNNSVSGYLFMWEG